MNAASGVCCFCVRCEKSERNRVDGEEIILAQMQRFLRPVMLTRRPKAAALVLKGARKHEQTVDLCFPGFQFHFCQTSLFSGCCPFPQTLRLTCGRKRLKQNPAGKSADGKLCKSRIHDENERREEAGLLLLKAGKR